MSLDDVGGFRIFGLFATEALFADRVDAGRRLARHVDHLQGQDVVVVALPRGGVPVAAEIARRLQAPLDVILVRKLGVPGQTELAMGAVGEDGVRVLNHAVIRSCGVTPDEVTGAELRERRVLQDRARRLRAGRKETSLAGRVVVLVDDGLATGATARAACQVARARGAGRVVLAVPVAPRGWERRMAGAADELICLATPAAFSGISAFYDDFSQLDDEEMVATLAATDRAGEDVRGRDDPGQAGDDGGRSRDDGGPARDDEVVVRIGEVELQGHLTVPSRAIGVVVFAHGSGSSRRSPRNRQVAQVLNWAGFATLLFDLLTPDEGSCRGNVFDIPLLASRLVAATRWLRCEPGLERLPVGWFGASTGAAAALWAACEPDAVVAAVVSRGGRPDLAGRHLAGVRAPTLLIVGSLDTDVLGLNRQALSQLHCRSHLTLIPGATHLFEEPGALEVVAQVALAWFQDQMPTV
jgi:putative phosphoribosyl transferase